MKNDDLLKRVNAICLGCSEATSEQCGDSHVTYRVRKKVFAYFLDNHHGDGIVSVCFKTRLGENLDLPKRDPKRFYLPAHIGKRGWAGMRLDVAKVDWNEVTQFVADSYHMAAPKTLRGA